MTEAERARGVGVVLSAVLLWVAFLPAPLPPVPAVALLLVALVPWLVVTDGLPPGRAARAGALLGGVFWALHLGWMLPLALRIGAVWPVAAWVGEVTLLALLWAVLGAGRAALRGRGLGPVLAVALAWVGVEWCRGALLGPLRFPWSGIAVPLARVPVLLQPAAWGGEALLALGVVAVNGWVAAAVPRRPGRRSAVRPGTVALVVVGAWVAAGTVRSALLNDRLELRGTALAVQPAVPLVERRGPDAAARAVETLRWGLAEGSEGDASLVILPETHLPLVTDSLGRPAEGLPDRGVAPVPQGLIPEIAGWAAQGGREVLVGAYLRDGRGAMNAVLRIGGTGLEGVYGKRALVPGVEWVPGGGLVPGRGPGVVEAPGRPGVLVCIESAWGSLARRRARQGAGWLLNVTNDAWLGRPGVPAPAFHQHPWHLALRSVETGLGALRVANTGWTGTIDPLGRWAPALPPYVRGTATLRAHSLPGPTLFLAWGAWIGPLCALLTAGAVALETRGMAA